jgi:hypothetical protein
VDCLSRRAKESARIRGRLVISHVPGWLPHMRRARVGSRTGSMWTPGEQPHPNRLHQPQDRDVPHEKKPFCQLFPRDSAALNFNLNCRRLWRHATVTAYLQSAIPHRDGSEWSRHFAAWPILGTPSLRLFGALCSYQTRIKQLRELEGNSPPAKGKNCSHNSRNPQRHSSEGYGKTKWSASFSF